MNSLELIVSKANQVSYWGMRKKLLHVSSYMLNPENNSITPNNNFQMHTLYLLFFGARPQFFQGLSVCFKGFERSRS